MKPSYKTNRLSVFEAFITPQESKPLTATAKLLSPKVVESLPSNFKNINSLSDAEGWYNNMLSESRLFRVNLADTDTIIGFVFVFVEDDIDAHIGYLLGESYWKKGYATELLQGLIDFVINESKWTKLIAGVDTRNKVSSKLLLKLGFAEQKNEDKEMLFYDYLLPQPQT